MAKQTATISPTVHCYIGSLETPSCHGRHNICRSLPHGQLRKENLLAVVDRLRSLPYRQLIKKEDEQKIAL